MFILRRVQKLNVLCCRRHQKRVMAQEGPTKAEINAIFKRLKSIPANKVYLKSRRI